MSDTEVYVMFVTGTLLLYIPSYCARNMLSGARFGAFGVMAAWLYNTSIGAMHVYFLEDSVIPFYGYFDNWLLGWLSLVMIFAHALSIPRPWQP